MDQTIINNGLNKTATDTTTVLEKHLDTKCPVTESVTRISVTEDVEVRRVDMNEYKGVAECLAQAFATDEVVRYFVDTPDMMQYSESYRWKLHVDHLRYIVAAHCIEGIVTTCGDDYDAVSLWLPPGTDTDNFLTLFRSGTWRLYYRLSYEGRARLMSEFWPLLHQTKASTLGLRDTNSMYLVYVGTKPSARGRGYAKKLIEHGTKMADEWKVPTYLESSNIVNIKFYEKLGFEYKKDVLLQRGVKPVALGIMVREYREAKDGQ